MGSAAVTASASPGAAAPSESGPATAADSTSASSAVDSTGYNSKAAPGADVGAATDLGAAPQPALPGSSSALGDPAALKAGDAGVVSNGPVPDTPENRAKYGSPDSHGGKRTKPAGN